MQAKDSPYFVLRTYNQSISRIRELPPGPPKPKPKHHRPNSVQPSQKNHYTHLEIYKNYKEQRTKPHTSNPSLHTSPSPTQTRQFKIRPSDPKISATYQNAQNFAPDPSKPKFHVKNSSSLPNCPILPQKTAQKHSPAPNKNFSQRSTSSIQWGWVHKPPQEIFLPPKKPPLKFDVKKLKEAVLDCKIFWEQTFASF